MLFQLFLAIYKANWIVHYSWKMCHYNLVNVYSFRCGVRCDFRLAWRETS